MASKIMPTGYDMLNAILIHDRCFEPIFSVTESNQIKYEINRMNDFMADIVYFKWNLHSENAG